MFHSGSLGELSPPRFPSDFFSAYLSVRLVVGGGSRGEIAAACLAPMRGSLSRLTHFCFFLLAPFSHIDTIDRSTSLLKNARASCFFMPSATYLHRSAILGKKALNMNTYIYACSNKRRAFKGVKSVKIFRSLFSSSFHLSLKSPLAAGAQPNKPFGF